MGYSLWGISEMYERFGNQSHIEDLSHPSGQKLHNRRINNSAQAELLKTCISHVWPRGGTTGE